MSFLVLLRLCTHTSIVHCNKGLCTLTLRCDALPDLCTHPHIHAAQVLVVNQRFEDSPEGLRVTTEIDVGLDMTSPLSVPINQVGGLSSPACMGARSAAVRRVHAREWRQGKPSTWHPHRRSPSCCKRDSSRIWLRPDTQFSACTACYLYCYL